MSSNNQHNCEDKDCCFKCPVFKACIRSLSLNKQEKEDVAQEARLGVWTFCKKNGKPENLGALIRRIVRNKLNDYLKEKYRKRGKEVVFEESEISDKFNKFMNQPDELKLKELYSLLGEHCDPLENKIIRLKAYGFTFKQIAELLDLNINSVSSSHRRTLEKLAKMVGDS